MKKEDIKKAQVVERVLKKHKKVLEKDYPILDFNQYLIHFYNIHGVGNTSFHCKYSYKMDILEKYEKRIVTVKPYGDPKLPFLGVIVQDDVYNHYLFDVMFGMDEELYLFVGVRIFAKNPIKSCLNFQEENKDLIIENEEKNVGFLT